MDMKSLKILLLYCQSLNQALYPILKRLEANKKVSTYSKEHNGRLRKYYQITAHGQNSIHEFLTIDWPHLEKIHHYIKGDN